MAFEEIVEGIPLDILYPAKHRYHIEITPQFKATLLSHSFSCIRRMPTVRGTKKDDHSIPLLSVVGDKLPRVLRDAQNQHWVASHFLE